MVTDMFGVLLEELGKRLDNADLRPDSNNSCLIRLKGGQHIQLELDKTGLSLVLGTELGVPPPGKYRENLFREALKANNMPYPLHGTLAYSKKSDQLVLFEKFIIQDLTGDRVAEAIIPFTQKAVVWAEAIKSSSIPLLDQTYSSQRRSGGIFGLHP